MIKLIGKLLYSAVEFLAAATIVSIICGLPVMWLWNGSVSNIFRWPLISYWEAVKIELLAIILFQGADGFTTETTDD